MEYGTLYLIPAAKMGLVERIVPLLSRGCTCDFFGKLSRCQRAVVATTWRQIVFACDSHLIGSITPGRVTNCRECMAKCSNAATRVTKSRKTQLMQFLAIFFCDFSPAVASPVRGWLHGRWRRDNFQKNRNTIASKLA